MEPIQDYDELRPWVDDTKEGIAEIIRGGCDIWFVYNGHDYFIEGGNNGYLIQDPRIGHEDDPYEDYPYLDYPGHEQAKTAEELMALPFLDGKTIFERFDELRFFDH